ncbi:MAG: hypothetical protein JNM52_03330 [Betaproteobacteria bacterium]|nr:hypothetical protein [Betaproteobacteria bacterium]
MSPLFKLHELSDLFVDASVCDESGRLMFLSCYGRDTTVQQLLASFTLPPHEGGFDTITLSDANLNGRGPRRRIQVNNKLTKITGRFPARNLFGDLVQTWLFDPVIQVPNSANQSAWVLEPHPGAGEIAPVRIWNLVKRLSPIPLLEHWQRPLLNSLPGLVRDLADSDHPPMGPIRAYRIQLPDDFCEAVSRLVKNHVLELNEGVV